MESMTLVIQGVRHFELRFIFNLRLESDNFSHPSENGFNNPEDVPSGGFKILSYTQP